MHNVKKYILTGVILGTIATSSAGLIALTNFVTEKKILANEQNAIKEGITSIFGDGSTIRSEEDLSEYKYTVHFYEIENNKSEFIGYAFKSEGSNMYGKIAFISGFSASNHSFIKMHLVKNEQTYASTLVNNYVNPVNLSERNIEDVSCGATYGAKLVRDMVDEANEVASKLWK